MSLLRYAGFNPLAQREAPKEQPKPKTPRTVNGAGAHSLIEENPSSYDLDAQRKCIKRCSPDWKPSGDFQIYTDHQGTRRIRNICKKCYLKYQSEYRAKRKESQNGETAA